MKIEIYQIKDQAKGNFNNGEILENKPIGFPGENGKLKSYSNIFYWAHAWTTNQKEKLIIMILIRKNGSLYLKVMFK